MKLHELPRAGSPRKRVGRGTGSGVGKTAGRGTKGQKSRSGHHTAPAWFEGGQMPLTQRIPKLRGFRGPSADRWAAVTIERLERFGEATVDLAKLQKAGLVPRKLRYLKIIGNGKLSKKVSITADRASAGAAKAIAASGGSLKLTERKSAPKAKAEPGEKTEPTTKEEPKAKAGTTEPKPNDSKKPDANG